MKSIFIILILSFFSGIIYYLMRKFNSKIIPAFVIMVCGMLFAYMIPVSESNELLLDRIITNLAPATFFLLAIDFDIKTLLQNKIGCSCKMGAKRYWLIVLMAVAVSFLLQYIAALYNVAFPVETTTAAAFVFGLVGSKTRLREINGTQEIATTMLYLLSAVVGMKIV